MLYIIAYFTGLDIVYTPSVTPIKGGNLSPGLALHTQERANPVLGSNLTYCSIPVTTSMPCLECRVLRARPCCWSSSVSLMLGFLLDNRTSSLLFDLFPCCCEARCYHLTRLPLPLASCSIHSHNNYLLVKVVYYPNTENSHVKKLMHLHIFTFTNSMCTLYQNEAVAEHASFYKIFRCFIFYISLEFTSLTKVIKRMTFAKMETFEG